MMPPPASATEPPTEIDEEPSLSMVPSLLSLPLVPIEIPPTTLR
jgi:hypothetical protein